LCFIFPSLNSFLNIALGKKFISDFRISGLFSGYDFVSFFTVLYLYIEYRCNNYRFDRFGYIQLLIGFAATAVTGRFGMVPYCLFFSYLLLRKFTLTKALSFGSAFLVIFFILYDRILLFYNTFLLLKDSLQLADPSKSNLSLEDYGSEGQEGFYQLSPLILYEEATRPFYHITKYILPTTTSTTVDSGPSFVILNIGVILFLFLYIYYFKSIYKFVSNTIFLTVLVIIMDIKFRIILVLMPTIWILLNLNRIKQQENLSQ